MGRKSIWVVCSACLVLLLAVMPAGAANRDFNKIDTIRIGVLAPVQLSPGQGIINACKMAADEINAAGGIYGKKIELFYGDTEGKPEKGVTAAKKLVLQDKVDVLVGEYSSGVALAIQPYLSGYQIVFIGTGVASVELTDNVKKDYAKNKYFFRHMINADRQADGVAAFMKDFVKPKLGVKKVAILAENAKWTECTFGLKKDLEAAGMDVVFFERFDVEIKDFSPIFSKMKTQGVEWIVQFLSHGASVPLVKAWQDNKPAPMGGCNVASMDHKFWDMTGGQCLYEITYNHIAPAKITDRTLPFWNTYLKRFGTNPVYTSGYSYDAVNFLAEVIKAKKSVKSDDIINGLETMSFKGVLHAQTQFDKQSHDLAEGRYVMAFAQWREGGKQVVFYPEKFKTGDYMVPSWYKK